MSVPYLTLDRELLLNVDADRVSVEVGEEAVRDLCRAREDAVADRTQALHQLPKLLLRRGLAYARLPLRGVGCERRSLASAR